jgi:hypothetical protein
MKFVTMVVLFGMMTSGSLLMAANDAISTSTEADIAQLEQLHAAFHRNASVHDPVNGDSAAVIALRIRRILALWVKTGTLRLTSGSPFDGNYIGRGNPNDPSTCPMPSGDSANQGTLCTFYTYVAGSFQAANKFISLSPAYNTHFGVSGTTATVYFECHYFNVDESAGPPSWDPVAHVAFRGTAVKVNGQWHFATAVSPKVGVPIP